MLRDDKFTFVVDVQYYDSQSKIQTIEDLHFEARDENELITKIKEYYPNLFKFKVKEYWYVNRGHVNVK